MQPDGESFVYVLWFDILDSYCCCFTSQQHLMSYQIGYRLVRVCIYGKFYNAVPLENQAMSTMTWYPTQSYYPDPEPTSPCLILIMPSTWLESHKYKLYKSLVWLDHWFEHNISRTQDQCSSDSATVADFTPLKDARSYQDGSQVMTV